LSQLSAENMGPVDYLVVEFPRERANFSGEVKAELAALVASGTVRVLDLLFMKKHADGTFEGFEKHDFDDPDAAALGELADQMKQILTEEDVANIAQALEPETIAAVLVWENTWAAPFAGALRRAGGELVASGRIPIQAILAAAEEAEDEAAAREGD
jgi:hypothetical protein